MVICSIVVRRFEAQGGAVESCRSSVEIRLAGKVTVVRDRQSRISWNPTLQ